MSSTLAMIFTVAINVPSNEPEKFSAEMTQEIKPLNLSGEWEGTLRDSQSKDKGSWTVKLNDDWLVLERGIETRRLLWQMTNEGGGKVKVKFLATDYVGTYRYEGDRVIIVLRDGKSDRPISFRPGGDRSLIILRRAKPGSLRFLGTDSNIDIAK